MVDTLRELKARERGAKLYLLIGEDSWGEFGAWRDPAGILALATLVVATRFGGRPAPAGWPPCVWLDNPRLEIASSTLRLRARAGRSLRYLVPDPVIAYIRRHRLYGAKP